MYDKDDAYGWRLGRCGSREVYRITTLTLLAFIENFIYLYRVMRQLPGIV